MKPKQFSQTKLLLAFEFGVLLGDIAKQSGREVTPELVKKAEEIIIGEFGNKTASKLACEMQVLLLAAFEV